MNRLRKFPGPRYARGGTVNLRIVGFHEMMSQTKVSLHLTRSTRQCLQCASLRSLDWMRPSGSTLRKKGALYIDYKVSCTLQTSTEDNDCDSSSQRKVSVIDFRVKGKTAVSPLSLCSIYCSLTLRLRYELFCGIHLKIHLKVSSTLNVACVQRLIFW